MTPRERAEALGWVGYGSWWGRSKRARTPIVWESDGPLPDGRWGLQWAVNLRGMWEMGTRRYPTESEALAAALELRDVVLS